MSICFLWHLRPHGCTHIRLPGIGFCCGTSSMAWREGYISVIAQWWYAYPETCLLSVAIFSSVPWCQGLPLRSLPSPMTTWLGSSLRPSWRSIDWCVSVCDSCFDLHAKQDTRIWRNSSPGKLLNHLPTPLLFPHRNGSSWCEDVRNFSCLCLGCFLEVPRYHTATMVAYAATPLWLILRV